MKSFNK